MLASRLLTCVSPRYLWLTGHFLSPYQPDHPIGLMTQGESNAEGNNLVGCSRCPLGRGYESARLSLVRRNGGIGAKDVLRSVHLYWEALIEQG